MATRTPFHARRPARACAAALCLLVSACGASAPPRELVDARAAYKRAESGPAMRLVPTALHEAKTSLDQAEAALQNDGDSDRTKDLAYVAQRKAELAEARAVREFLVARGLPADRVSANGYGP
ncbi:MAG TPA: DUF4398 domain-containing protein, partial [Polyangiaceae bacterium]|nr:DUF4398 domain-containing protein [Polyangiaceae bacterium]